MNILILNWRDITHPLSGGAEVMLLEHAKAWHKDGAKITWFSSQTSRQASKEKINGIEYVRKGSHYTVFLWAFLFYLKGKLGSPDIVVDCFHFFPFFTPLYMRNKKILGVIHEVAGKVWFQNIFYPIALVGYFFEPLIIKIYKNRKFITVSGSTKKELSKIGISQSRIYVIENGIKPTNVVAKRNMNTLLFLGRISKDKGIEDAIEAFKIIHETLPNLKLKVIGKGENISYIKKIKGKAKSLGLGKSIDFLGFLTEKEKYRFLGESTLLIHPSHKEGWGLTVIEANSMGTPVVGYNVEGLRDSIIDGKTGILVDSNPKSLAGGIVKILENMKLYNEYSKNAKDWSRNFTWKKSAAKSLKVIKSL